MMAKLRFKRMNTARLTLGLSLISNLVFASDSDPLSKASNWLVTLLVSMAFSVLAPMIIFSLWQLYQGHKDVREVVKPILITAAIVATPAVVLLAKAAFGS